MPNQVFDLNPVDYLIPGAVGEPGKRVFYLQARKGHRLITVVCEKEHVVALAVAAQRLLLALVDADADAVTEPDPATMSMALEYPLEPLFRVGQINLGYDEISKRLVIIVYESLEEGDESTPSAVRFWVTPAQVRALSVRGQQVVAAGRPTCAMCGQPIDPEGHFCPRKNGHRT
ncbi:MAG: DUF3090 domain-containing protein [Anaerolineae bacterium]|nr:DUF3090 domain-containing protein [Anaerolineae bacterium]